jgi:hypothetical protein
MKACDYCGWPIGRSRSCAEHMGRPLLSEKSLWEQLKNLYALNDDLEEESAYADELRKLRRQEIQDEFCHPSCCDLAKKYLFPYREINHRTEEVLRGGKPVWKSTFRDGWNDGDGIARSLTITFCPFCGVLLPNFRKKEKPPEHIIVENDGHCDGCGERYGYGNCFCSLPESAWEIEA